VVERRGSRVLYGRWWRYAKGERKIKASLLATSYAHLLFHKKSEPGKQL
jgi:hypothetical protein